MSQVTIIGAGMVGLALANKLAAMDIGVTLIESRLPDLDFSIDAHRHTQRVSALGLASRDLLQSINAWEALRAACITPFSKIEAWSHESGQKVHFDAAEIGKKQLGYIVENREVVRVLWQCAEQHPLITIECPKQLTTLDDMREQTQLIVAADGGNSWVRRQAGIDCSERSYGQTAIVATIQSAKPHQNTAYQSFLKTGPLGVLPLHDPHQLSIVWSADDDYAAELIAMNDTAFNRALSNALDLRLGKLELMTERKTFPLIRRHAKQYAQPGLVLIGDAAHTIHPLAGQGVNLGFKDVKALAAQLGKAQQKEQPLGSLNALRHYERERKVDNQRMHLAMQLFRDHATQLAWGFGVVDKQPWLKKKVTAIVM